MPAVNSTADILHPATPARAQDLPYRSRLIARTALAPAVWQLRFEAPQGSSAAVTPWHFTSGQYATLGLINNANAPLRPYSIASAPDDGFIDLHVRDTGHGLSHALGNLATGDSVAFGHPAGSCVPAHAIARPLLLLAGGVGIAPMASIVAARAGARAPCHLYWGVSEHEQLYLDAHWHQQVSRGRLASYHAVTEQTTPHLRSGMIGPAVIHDLPDLSDFAIYLAGPAAMVAATVPLLTAHGAQKEYIFGDGITL